jgi:hypothetical protein
VVSGLDRLDPPSGRRQTLGFHFVLALPDCQLHVVYSVSTPYEEAKNSPFVHSENSILCLTEHPSLVAFLFRTFAKRFYISARIQTNLRDNFTNLNAL